MLATGIFRATVSYIRYHPLRRYVWRNCQGPYPAATSFSSTPNSVANSLSFRAIAIPTPDYAGNSNSFYQTCSGVCYQDWVLGSPSNYDNAFFEVNHVRVYGEPGELTVIISSDASRSYTAETTLRMISVIAGLMTFLVMLFV